MVYTALLDMSADWCTFDGVVSKMGLQMELQTHSVLTKESLIVLNQVFLTGFAF